MSQAEEEVGTPITGVVTGLPVGTTLGHLEGLILPRCSGRIVAIGMQGEGTAVIEFALMSDADNCVGEHLLNGAMVKLQKPGEPLPGEGAAAPAPAPPPSLVTTSARAALVGSASTAPTVTRARCTLRRRRARSIPRVS